MAGLADLRELMGYAAQLGGAAAAVTGLDRDLETIKRAALNLAMASEFPLAAGLQAWRRKTLPERVTAALNDEQIRAWLLAWAASPRPLAPKGGRR